VKRGIRVIDSAVGGLGGCPYAKSATGNVATEKVVQRMQQLGFETGVDLEQLEQIGRDICLKLDRNYIN
jgi:hydroxymethylglutaryl-CoA lyase